VRGPAAGPADRAAAGPGLLQRAGGGGAGRGARSRGSRYRVLITLNITQHHTGPVRLPAHGPPRGSMMLPRWQEALASRAAGPPRLLRSRTSRRSPQWCEFESWPRQSNCGGARRAAGRRAPPASRPVPRRSARCCAASMPGGHASRILPPLHRASQRVCLVDAVRQVTAYTLPAVLPQLACFFHWGASVSGGS